MFSRYSIAKVLTTAGLFCTAFSAVMSQDLKQPEVAGDLSAFASTQTESRRNYALLQPITSRRGSEKQSLPQQMLKPLNRQDRPAAKNGIVVVPKSFKSKIFDQHQFLVKNEGSKILRSATVIFTAPIGSTIQQVMPKPEFVSGREVGVQIEGLAPGTEQMVEIAIVYPRNEFARFSSTLENLEWAGQRDNRARSSSIKDRSYSMPALGMLKPKTNQPLTTVASSPSRLLAPSEIFTQQHSEPVNIKDSSSMLSPISKGESNADTLASSFAGEIEAPNEIETTVLPLAPVSEAPGYSISTKIVGPMEVNVGAEEEFSIVLRNVSIDSSKEIVVQLSIPDCMKITVLDREAWYDSENRKLTWKVAKLDMGSVEKIRYKAVVKSDCSVEQIVTTGMNGQFESKSNLQTTAR